MNPIVRIRLVMDLCAELELPATEGHLLLALVAHVDDDGVCWPGIARLCEVTGRRPSVVGAALVRLEKRGLIETRRRRGRTAVRRVLVGADASTTTTRAVLDPRPVEIPDPPGILIPDPPGILIPDPPGIPARDPRPTGDPHPRPTGGRDPRPTGDPLMNIPEEVPTRNEGGGDARHGEPTVTGVHPDLDAVLAVLAVAPNIDVEPMAVNSACRSRPGADVIAGAHLVASWAHEGGMRTRSGSRLLFSALDKLDEREARQAGIRDAATATPARRAPRGAASVGAHRGDDGISIYDRKAGLA